MATTATDSLLKRLVQKHDLVEAENLILRSARPCYYLDLGTKGGRAPLGKTRCGGTPDLPDHWAWPTTSNGAFLNFIMQVDLSELPAGKFNPLPRKGMLYFFLESDEPATAVQARVMLLRGAAQLKRHKEPPYERLAHDYYVDLNPYVLRPRLGIDLPNYGSSYQPKKNRPSEFELMRISKLHAATISFPRACTVNFTVVIFILCACWLKVPQIL